MKHHLKISVSKKPQPDSLLSCRKVTLRERILRFLFGDKRSLTILVPGMSVDQVVITEIGEGGEE